MPAFLSIALAVSCGTALHLLGVVVASRLAGVGLRDVVFGLGPEVARIGRLRCRLLPVGGAVRLSHSSDATPSGPWPAGAALDAQGLACQALVSVAGPAMLLLVAGALLGWQAPAAFLSGFAEIVRGALQPLSEGQRLVGEAGRWAAQAGPWTLAGTVAAKMAALNLLPLPPFDGGAVVRLAGAGLGVPAGRPGVAALGQVGVWVSLAGFVSWLLALGAAFATTAR
ncbi:site-2 protease family protein [Eleftheria terrae]|uniref:site-2 protease family protein n=1 Tax=Eleftheria terrae TaxID=1597781 RepID=UPI00263BA60E|nr:site-2 protease family protein [Eleftheria terrae]WKB53368.1 hypothetical protein N7L95_02930 [Eleftheria terrae]